MQTNITYDNEIILDREKNGCVRVRSTKEKKKKNNQVIELKITELLESKHKDFPKLRIYDLFSCTNISSKVSYLRVVCRHLN